MVAEKLRIFKFCTSTVGVVYVWCLPVLSKIGFSEEGSTSVSAFIANPPATGAMASVSFMPMTLMWQYQNIVASRLDNKRIEKILENSLCGYQVCYCMFLICTDSYVPDSLHFATVFLFCLSFFVHSGCIVRYLDPCVVTKGIFGVGTSSLVALIGLLVTNNEDTMWFWGLECVGLTSMFLFTPVEWVFVLNPTLKESLRHLDITQTVN